MAEVFYVHSIATGLAIDGPFTKYADVEKAVQTLVAEWSPTAKNLAERGGRENPMPVRIEKAFLCEPGCAECLRVLHHREDFELVMEGRGALRLDCPQPTPHRPLA